MDWSTCVPQGSKTPTLECIPYLIQYLLNWAFTFAGIIAVAMVIFAGFKFITSDGDPKQVDGARKTLLYAIIGLVLVLLSFLIVNLIATITGVSCIQFMGFNACSGTSGGGTW